MTNSVRLATTIAFLTGVAWLCGCSTWQVQTMQDPQANFGRYQTFAFAPLIAPEEAPIGFNQIVQREIRSAIQREMEKRGYKLSEKTPDLMVSLYGRVADKQRVVGGSSYTGSPYYYGYYSGYDRGWVKTVDYKVGTLVIDLTDAKQNRLIWQGIAQGTLEDRQSTGEKLTERVGKVVGKVFTEYPHSAGTHASKKS